MINNACTKLEDLTDEEFYAALRKAVESHDDETMRCLNVEARRRLEIMFATDDEE